MGKAKSEISLLRVALADAERSRDDAVARAAHFAQAVHDEQREEQHRLRNMLSVARAIVRRTSADVEKVEDYCGLLEGRLNSYFRLQALLVNDWAGGADLAVMLADELLILGLQEGEQVELVGPPVNLTSRAASVLVLTFQALAAASVLSGRIEHDASSLRIEWRHAGQGPNAQLLIDWIDIAPEVDVPNAPRSSWDDWLEEAIAHQLAGTMTMERAGSMHVVRLVLPGSVLRR